MNERMKELALQADLIWHKSAPINIKIEKFAELIVRDCIDKIETYRVPVGNSAAGELACEWTYDALKDIRDEIREHFGVKNDT